MEHAFMSTSEGKLRVRLERVQKQSAAIVLWFEESQTRFASNEMQEHGDHWAKITMSLSVSVLGIG